MQFESSKQRLNDETKVSRRQLEFRRRNAVRRRQTALRRQNGARCDRLGSNDETKFLDGIRCLDDTTYFRGGKHRSDNQQGLTAETQFGNGMQQLNDRTKFGSNKQSSADGNNV